MGSSIQYAQDFNHRKEHGRNADLQSFVDLAGAAFNSKQSCQFLNRVGHVLENISRLSQQTCRAREPGVAGGGEWAHVLKKIGNYLANNKRYTTYSVQVSTNEEGTQLQFLCVRQPHTILEQERLRSRLDFKYISRHRNENPTLTRIHSMRRNSSVLSSTSATRCMAYILYMQTSC